MTTALKSVAVLAALAAAAALGVPALVAAPDGEREISFFHIHTKESLTITYKRGGQYIPEAMEKLNWILRDWRKDKATKMSPATIDILWEIHTELGSKEPIHIISGYRSPETNEMLRRTVGGQAKNSQHMTGSAIDVYFPDVPSKYVRYAALVRERGGVGYYPTSALPFTHVDSGRVRHWPKMPKDELALLFPNGRSRHVSSGGTISPGDYERAKSRRKELAIEVANYFELKIAPKPPVSIVASVGLPKPPAPKPAVRPPQPKPPEAVVAAAKPEPAVPAKPASIAAIRQAEAPKLVAAPRIVERPSRFAPRPSDSDRKDLDKLVTLAALDTAPAPAPAPKLIAPPTPVVRPAKPPQQPDATPGPEAGAHDPAKPHSAAQPAQWTTTWAAAPEYDDDHPDEMAYRPFPLAPLLTETASFDDPALAKMVHPDLARTLEMIDEDGKVQPMKFRPREKVAALMWSQKFRGEAVQIGDAQRQQQPAAPGLAERAVKTVAR